MDGIVGVVLEFTSHTGIDGIDGTGMIRFGTHFTHGIIHGTPGVGETLGLDGAVALDMEDLMTRFGAHLIMEVRSIETLG